MKLEFALVLLTLLVGGIAADDKTKSPKTPKPSSTTPAPPTTTPKPSPVPDGEQKDYILSFMSYGISYNEDNLFDFTWKKAPRLQQIFDYEKGKKEDFASTELLGVVLPSKTFNLYVHEKDLNPLLNATYAVFYPGNYSYQLYHSTYYGRVAAETFLSQQLYNGILSDDINKNASYFTADFRKSVQKDLVEDKNYTGFLAKYGTHYFSTVKFGGMIRMQSHTTAKFVRDVSESGFEQYLAEQLELTIGQTLNDSSPPYDFYYHNHCDNSTYGGDKKFNVSSGGAKDWILDLETSKSPEVVPIDFVTIPMDYLMRVPGLLPPGTNATEIKEGLQKAIQIELDKFKVKSYMEAMDVVRKNPYGKSLGGSFDAEFLYSYFEDKLKNVTLDGEYEDNVWAAEHNAQAILNRRGWFEKPYPPYPTTLAPTTEPTKPANATEAAATTEATTKKA